MDDGPVLFLNNSSPRCLDCYLVIKFKLQPKQSDLEFHSTCFQFAFEIRVSKMKLKDPTCGVRKFMPFTISFVMKICLGLSSRASGSNRSHSKMYNTKQWKMENTKLGNSKVYL